MTHLQKLRTTSILKWVSSIVFESHFESSETLQWSMGSFHIARPRFYRTKKIDQSENLDADNGENVMKISSAARKDAQAALLEYLLDTRGIQFMDAENMSKNSPYFLQKLTKNIEDEKEIRRSVTRFLRYHPINEFEPFFESLGLKPSEYGPFLPQNLMFLSDDYAMLENYKALCSYGIARNKIGKVYKEATEVFRYDVGVLSSKFQAYEELGLGNSFLIKAVVSSPRLLIGGPNMDFLKALEILKEGGIKINWIEEQLLEQNSYKWCQILSALSLFNKMGHSEEQIGRLINQHPGLIFDGSGNGILTLTAFLMKFGSTAGQICSMFMHFPQIQIHKFALNLRRCYMFLNEIEMDVVEIGKIVRSHAQLLGVVTLKKTNSLLSKLNVGKKRLCNLIQENPQEIARWCLGSKVEPLPNSGEAQRFREEKIKFLLDLGFEENSKKMTRALKVFRGRGDELWERFDCIVKAGLDRKDVCEMVMLSPQILNQSKELLETKIDLLVNELGYPLSTLVKFPSFLCYTRQRVRLRLSMYNWLKNQRKANSKLAMSTVLACSDGVFMGTYVNPHPGGPQVWEDLRNQIYSE